ncbi:hypothetical protein [Luteibacter sp.]|jgi:uncharacterized delta-60 repeat protein|uniref:hypothetical protein n=1 Tax=Luteibacter sp. TaxID=1886636 RepID=UPI002F410FFC
MSTEAQLKAGDVETIFRAPFDTFGLRALPLSDPLRSMYLLGIKKDPDVAAKKEILVARVDAEGRPDTGFGTGGIASASIDFPGWDALGLGMVATDDGGVIAAFRDDAGVSTLGLVRFKNDGSLDQTFGTGGVVIHDIFGARSDANPTKPRQRDTLTLPFQEAFASGSRGEIAPAKGRGLYFAWNTGPGGREGGLLRTKSDGSIDTSFGDNGYVEVYYPGSSQTIPRGVQELSDRSVIVVGSIHLPGKKAAVAARFNERGKLDPAFGTNGFFVLRGEDVPEPSLDGLFFTAAGEAPNEAIVFSGHMTVSGSQTYGLLAATDHSGQPLASFNGGKPVVFGLLGGTVESFADGGLIVQDDGKIVAGGYSALQNAPPVDMLVVRFLPNGKVDTTFASPRGWVKIRPLGNEYNYLYGVSLTSDGKILVAGDAGRDGTDVIAAVVRISS